MAYTAIYIKEKETTKDNITLHYTTYKLATQQLNK